MRPEIIINNFTKGDAKKVKELILATSAELRHFLEFMLALYKLILRFAPEFR
jgi:hypothetical protein